MTLDLGYLAQVVFVLAVFAAAAEVLTHRHR